MRPRAVFFLIASCLIAAAFGAGADGAGAAAAPAPEEAPLPGEHTPSS